MMKNRIGIGLLLLWSIWGLCGCKKEEEMVFFASENTTAAVTGLQAAETKEETDQKLIKVYICGAVAEPGVVALEEGSRVIDAVLLAGGMTEQAAESAVNLAAKLNDEEKIYVPTKEEVSTLQTKEAKEDLVNINTADPTKLCRLPGIGESKANDIIRYREKNGDFQKTEDIMKVPGIKENLYEKISGKITVE